MTLPGKMTGVTLSEAGRACEIADEGRTGKVCIVFDQEGRGE